MSNHIHLIIQRKQDSLSDLIRDMKRHIVNTIHLQILLEPESRKDWMLKRFEFAAAGSTTNINFKFWRSGNHPEEIYSQSFFGQN